MVQIIKGGKAMKRILLYTFIFFVMLAGTASAKTYYVDANAGNDSFGGTKEKPYKSIQMAADKVSAGDTVIVMPGVYYETVEVKASGTKENPIVFRAYDQSENATIITQADRDIREGKVQWTLENEELQIYSVPYPKNPTRVLADEVDLQGYYSLYRLERYCGNDSNPLSPTYVAGSKNGFYYDTTNQKLYVRLHPDTAKYGSRNPNERVMSVPCGDGYTDMDLFNGKRGNAVNTGKENSTFSVTSETDAYVVISGFTFVTPTWNGVFCRADNVTVTDCWFSGCQTGVGGGAVNFYDYTYITKDLTVQFCHFDTYPSYEEAMEIMAERVEATKRGEPYGYEYQFWQRKSVGAQITCRNTYGGDEQGGFIGHLGENWTLRNNYITNMLDGMSYYATSPYSYWRDGYGSSMQWPGYNIRIYENRFEHCLDNAMEFEDRLNGLDMHHNEFVDCFEPLSWQPLGGRPFPTNLMVHHNLFYATEEFMNDWYTGTNKKYQISAFKLGTPMASWQTFPWMLKEPYDYVKGRMIYYAKAEDYGFQVYNNTIILGEHSDLYAECASTGSPDHSPNFKFANNLVMTGTTTNRAAPAGQIGLEDRGYEFEKNMFINANNETIKSDPEAGFISNGGCILNVSLEDVFCDPKNYNFELKENSPAINAGKKIPGKADTEDVGAVPYGKTWHIDYSPKAYGDINCDGEVTLADIIEISLCYNATDGDDNFKPRCDMNFDGVINEKDTELAYKNYVELENRG